MKIDKYRNNNRIIGGLQLGIGFILIGFGIAKWMDLITYRISGLIYLLIGTVIFVWGIARYI